ncbi:MAG: hypothetical protein FJW91_06560 [Actinobacteria bacterium]|nr:hypothetical protein [Actinomycetota bacterium]
MRPTPYVASLRVYEPIDSFELNDQARWKEIKITESTGYEEQLRALKRTIISDSLMVRGDGAHIIDHDGKRYVAPWSTARRVWAALEDFKSSLPISVIPFFIPPSMEEAIREKGEVPENKVPHILTETWMIPPRWFSLFDPEERLRGANNGVPFTIARTELELAKKRCINAHMAVRKAFGPGPAEEEIIQLLNWLNVFDPRSKVELDYGGLAVYLDKLLRESGEDGLNADSSIEDVHHSIAGLSAGDGVMAGEGYERLVSRWRRVSSLEQAM